MNKCFYTLTRFKETNEIPSHSGVIWLKYCRYGVKHYLINQYLNLEVTLIYIVRDNIHYCTCSSLTTSALSVPSRPLYIMHLSGPNRPIYTCLDRVALYVLVWTKSLYTLNMYVWTKAPNIQVTLYKIVRVWT